MFKLFATLSELGTALASLKSTVDEANVKLRELFGLPPSRTGPGSALEIDSPASHVNGKPRRLTAVK
jgi:hypothetical protein